MNNELERSGHGPVFVSSWHLPAEIKGTHEFSARIASVPAQIGTDHHPNTRLTSHVDSM